MNIKHTYLFLLSCLLCCNSFSQESIHLITKKHTFTAGERINLEFKSTQKTAIQLYCANSYGSTLVTSDVKNNKLSFTIPPHLNSKTGILNWKLITKETSLSGNLTIIPKTKPNAMETYIGPPSIEAGGKDFTMFVVIPTDSLDNPLKKNTPVIIQYQFLSEEIKKPVLTNNLIGYKKIYSPIKSGRMILSSNSYQLFSKEFDVNVMPAIATNFKISAKRNHKYADGNQITTFSTSIIKDKNNNTISDGSFVEFFIKNKKGNILKTNGKTINGVAFAKILHPEYEDLWSIKAYINGIAESNTIQLSFKKVIFNIDVEFSKNNRNLKVGPLKSFMNQMIPDGLKVSLSIYKNGKLVDNVIKKSRDGFVNFKLNANIYPKGIYKIVVSAAGINQSFNSKKLW